MMVLAWAVSCSSVALDEGNLETAAGDTGSSGAPTDTDAVPDDSGAPRDSGDSGTDLAPVRFVALGDAGFGDDDQFAVADAMATVCLRQGCDFALYLGDNFYNSGVESIYGPQFEEKFELPYANVDFPFYVLLGNHDYGADGLGFEVWQAAIEVEYTSRSAKWVLPDFYYNFQVANVEFWALDTNAIVWGLYDEQATWFESGMANASSSWRIVYGHHPYISNGDHGNAGEYEGFDSLPFGKGEEFKGFFDAAVCGKADLYLSAHDHSLQWLEPACGVEMIVSGAGASTTELTGDNAARFQSATHGFVWVEILGDQLTAEFWSIDGELLYTHAVRR